MLHEGTIQKVTDDLDTQVGRLHNAFLQFLSVAVYHCSGTRFTAMLRSLIYKDNLLHSSAIGLESFGLPWPAAFTKEWIRHFGSLVDNFARRPAAPIDAGAVAATLV